MESIYIETTAINKALETGINGSQIASALSALELQPKTSILTLQEIAKTYQEKENKDIAQNLCKILKDIKPTFIPEISHLIIWEIQKLWQSSKLPFFKESYQEAIESEVVKLASGMFSDEARNFILNRDKQLREEIPIWSKKYLKSVKEVKQRNPEEFKKLKTFYNFLNYYKDQYSSLVAKHLQKNVIQIEADLITSHLDDFPVLRSLVFSDLYMTFILVAHEEMPAKDKTHDLKHIISAAYCNKFLSADEDQIKLVPHINESLRVLAWDDFLAQFELVKKIEQ